MKKYRLEIIVFLSGAIEMGLELLASRILSPYVGSSNVVWTSIIGIILASMSLGYWYGGRKAEENIGQDKLAEILLEATFFTSLIPLFETLFVKRIAGLSNNLILSAILCAIIVFSIPSFLLAMISPIAVKIKTEKTSDVGASSGGISALSTQVDMGLESYLDTNSNEMGAEYLKFYDLFDYYNKNAKNTLLIGGAAYTYPIHYLNKYSDKNIDVVEIDDKMTKIAEEEFGLNLNDDRIKVYSQDGRSFFNYSKNKYDTILIDAFKGLNAPFELTTYEALENAKTLLNDDGLVITNIISGIEGNEADFLKYEYATYKAVFDDVKVFKVKEIRTPEETQNLILVGIKGNLNIDDERKNEYSYLLDRELTGIESDKKIVTDDFAPIGN